MYAGMQTVRRRLIVGVAALVLAAWAGLYAPVLMHGAGVESVPSIHACSHSSGGGDC